MHAAAVDNAPRRSEANEVEYAQGIPPPRAPLIRFHGVLAPHAKWRPAVVPRPTSETRKCAAGSADAGSHPSDAPATAPSKKRAKAEERARKTIAPSAPLPGPTPPLPEQAGAHLRAASSRIDWAELLKRTYDVDALACPKCGGRLKFIAVITDARVARAILESLGERTERAVVARARSATFDDGIDPPSAWDE